MFVNGWWVTSTVDENGHIWIDYDEYVENVDYEMILSVIENQKAVKEERKAAEKYKDLIRNGKRVFESPQSNYGSYRTEKFNAKEYNFEDDQGFNNVRKFNQLPTELRIAMMKPRKTFVVEE